jgi:hypothetical protein
VLGRHHACVLFCLAGTVAGSENCTCDPLQWFKTLYCLLVCYSGCNVLVDGFGGAVQACLVLCYVRI